MSAKYLSAISLCSVIALVVGCTKGESTTGPSPVTPQQLAFEYRILEATPELIEDLAAQLESGRLSLDEPERWGLAGEPCLYRAEFNVPLEQQDPDTGLHQHTHAPYLNAYGHPHSSGFNFLLDGYQARTQETPCDAVEATAQGVQLISQSGIASREWRRGDAAALVLRPELGPRWLGEPLELRNEFKGRPLAFEHAIDGVREDGHIRGRFRFLAASPEGDRLAIVTNGVFGMNDQQ